ncbi:beta-1,3-galactosyltransferase 1-like [Biomphalaria glabrata]|uniref:Hexosyltransferase n=1 Tax=Biomphalaria glabrata TaxID=6526 RepID=A0A9U8E3V2_BIOGL|nr:beta-1,3-galactosyltransferase 1-like [Biomphalaria glabrata]
MLHRKVNKYVIFTLVLLAVNVIELFMVGRYIAIIDVSNRSLLDHKTLLILLNNKLSNKDSNTASEHLDHMINVVSPHSFKLINKPKVSCYHSELVICVLSKRNHFHTRRTIRETWGSYAYDRRNNASLIFFIGSEITSTTLLDSDQPMVDAESNIFGDILQEEYIDSYNNLSLKTVSVLKWVTFQCPKSKFILKSDDDMFINVPFLVRKLREIEHRLPQFVMGSVRYHEKPNRQKSSKIYTPYSVYKEDEFPPFTAGPTYAMTTKTAKLLYQTTLQLPLFRLEDVYVTGFCAQKANVSLVNNAHFLEGKHDASGCLFRNQISGEGFTTEEIIQIYKELNDENSDCD